jgi:hypothetical protein
MIKTMPLIGAACARRVQKHGTQIALLIQRGDSRVFIPVTLG